MIRNHEEDGFVAVRVQDPRTQNEGSWNSYVDYKIFLHTNSKAFTAKTSCVRRRYSEFVWLKRKLQKNAGLVPVPDLPGKSFFSFRHEDFLERRRQGLQIFLDKVLHMTVCLSDSQLHLFLQTQLPVSHIEDCVQGHTPYTVTDAILTYASSNRGFAQAQEDDPVKEPSLTVSYESMESPTPHQPFPQTKHPLSTELLPGAQSDPVDGLLELCHREATEERTTVRILQRNNHLEAVVEGCDRTEASFFLGDSPEDEDPASPQTSCLIQTPVEVHSPMGDGFGDCGTFEDVPTSDTGENTASHLDTKTGGEHSEDMLVLKEPNQDQRDGSALTPASIAGPEGPDTESEGSAGPEETHKDEREDGTEIPADTAHSSETIQQEVDDVRTSNDEDSRSLPSSNESIVQVSDEESVCGESDDLITSANGYMHMNGCPVDKDLQYIADIRDFSRSLEPHVPGAHVTEHGDFRVLASSSVPGSADSKYSDQGTATSLPSDTRGDS